MRLSIRYAAGAAALLSLSQPALAQGAPCVQPTDLADAVTYAIPMMMDSVQTTCAGTLPAESFVMSEGDAFSSRFAAMQDQSWEGTRRLLFAFMQADAQSTAMSGMLGDMDDEALRPFVDAIVGPMLAEEITPSSCTSIEQILPLVAPLPAENYGPLLATIFGLVGDSDDKLKLCPVEQ